MAGEDTLTKDRLSTPEAVLTLGALAVRSLEAYGMVVLFTAFDGTIQICPPEEFRLDAISEEDSIVALIEQGKTDEDIVQYLKGRSARLLKEGNHSAKNL